MILFFLGFYWSSSRSFINPNLSVKGSGAFHLSKKQKKDYFGSKTEVYHGDFIFFTTQSKTYYNLPCQLYCKRSDWFNLSGYTYLENVEIVFSKNKGTIKINKKSGWRELDHKFSLALWRSKLKEKTYLILKRYYLDEKILKTFYALTSAEIDDKLLRFHFSRTGLLHLLALSGFHFTLISSCLIHFFSPFFRKKMLHLLLIMLLSAYVIYLGDSPSIFRAYLATILYSISYLFGYQARSLNCLGLAALLSFVDDPWIIKNIGFQLSYMATFCLLHLNPLFSKLLDSKNHICRLSRFLKQGINLNLSVTLLSLPLLLYHFNSFAWISFFFNLFVPALFSVSMILLLCGLALEPFSIVASAIHSINQTLMKMTLSLIYETPPFCTIDLTCSSLSPESCAIMITVLWVLTSLFFKTRFNNLF